MSIDGDKRLARQAKKHERIVMSIVRHNDDEGTYYEVFTLPVFLEFVDEEINGRKKGGNNY